MKDVIASNKEIESLKEQLRKQEKLSSLGMLCAGIAHEIRNPLNFIINFSRISGSLLKEYRETFNKNATDIDDEDKKDMEDIFISLNSNLQKITEHGNNALAIINSILLYSRGKEESCQLTDVVLLTQEYVRLSYHAMRANYKDFNTAINEDYEKKLPPVNLNPQDYIRVVLNLMNNAWYAVWKKLQTHPASYRPGVHIKLYREDQSLILIVEDNGIGMDKETQEKIYEVFYTTKPVGQGTGLGMAIVKEIVEQKYHGHISFTSLPGEFTSFTLSFPLNL